MIRLRAAMPFNLSSSKLLSHRFSRSSRALNIRFSVRYDVPGKASENGMDRFFTATSLSLYRRLAGDKINATERNRVLKVLAEEWGAFTRGCRMSSVTCFRPFQEERRSTKARPKLTRGDSEVPALAQRNHFFERPPIVLTTSDRDELFSLIRTALTTMDPEVSCFLREELERADIVSGEMPPSAIVSIGSTVRFMDHEAMNIKEVKLVLPREANGIDLISVIGGLGSALIGLSPGQRISWYSAQTERRTTVLEISKNS